MTAEMPEGVVRVKRVGERPPRCHYCGNESWDLVENAVGRQVRLRHPRTVRGECPPPPDGWSPCYRCDRMLAPSEQRPVSLRLDVNLGRVREERLTRAEALRGYEPTPVEERNSHSHHWPGARPGRIDGHPFWKGRYEGDPVEGCGGCYRRVTAQVERSEWDDFVVELEDGTEVPYVEQYEAVEAVRCAWGSGCEAIEDDADRDDDEEDSTQEAAGEALSSLVPAEEPGLDVKQLMAVWKKGDRQTRTHARRLVADGLLRAVKADRSGRLTYVRTGP